MPAGHKGRGIRRRPPEDGIVGRQEALGEVAIGGSQVRIPATRSSFTKRSCRVRLTRSLRPRARGEKLTMCSMPSWAKARIR